MVKVLEGSFGSQGEGEFSSDLDALAREGARRMLAAALEAEVAEYVSRHREAKDEQGRARVVRNGRARTRKVTMGAGTVEVRAPRVHDRRDSQKFTSRVLPPYMRRSPKVAEVLPILYLRGLSTGDFREALPVLLGEDASGLSPANVSRLIGTWEEEHEMFGKRDLSGVDYVYVWADGVHVNVRLGEQDRLCMGSSVSGVRPLLQRGRPGPSSSVIGLLSPWPDRIGGEETSAGFHCLLGDSLPVVGQKPHPGQEHGPLGHGHDPAGGQDWIHRPKRALGDAPDDGFHEEAHRIGPQTQVPVLRYV